MGTMKPPRAALPKPPKVPTLRSALPKLPDPAGELKKGFGLLGTPFGMWGTMRARSAQRKGGSAR